MALATLIKRLQDIMRGDAGVGGDEQRLSQIVWILFLKIFDYKEEEWELMQSDYVPIIPKGYRWRDWVTGASVKDQMTGEELIDFVNNKLFRVLSGDAVKNEKGEDVYLFSKTDRASLLVKEFMKESTNFMKNGVLLRQLLNIFDEIDFSDYDERHAFNDIYETLLKGLQKNNGEFYTPRAITSFVVDKVDPKIGEKVADFACGTGGFLVDALHHVEDAGIKVEDLPKLQHSFYGVEKKQLPYMLCTTNMLLNDIAEPDIMHDNSLEQDVRRYTDDDKFDVILMNPPYGGSELEIVQKNFPAELRNSETADLFMIEIMYRLNKNGRCGVVLPDGFIFGTDNSKSAIKKKLLEEFNLHTVIRLPGSCFAPYTGIATNLLFFDKTEPTTDVWFYRFDLPNEQKFSMQKNPMTREKMATLEEWWDNRVEIKDEKEDSSMTETWKARKVSVDEIAANNYSLDFCGFPNEEKVILSPEETVANYLKQRKILEEQLNNSTNALKSMINGISVNTNSILPIGRISSKLIEVNKSFPNDMKDAFLQAAMQGKLTEQLESDSSVDELLVSIQKEKEKLIAEKKIKKEKSLSDIDEEEIPFDIPANWRWVRLKSICTKIVDGDHNPPRGTLEKTEYLMLSAQNINSNKLVDLEQVRYLTKDIFEQENLRTQVQMGDILFTIVGTLGRSCIFHGGYHISFQRSVAVISTMIYNRYLKYILDSPYIQQYMVAKATGTAQKGFYLNQVNNLLIPVPSLEEQRRIVERLDALLPLCEDLKEE